MKFKSFILWLIFVVGCGILIPRFLVISSDLLGLPIINYFLLKIIGLVLLILGLSIIFYSSFLFIKLGKGTPVPTDPPKKLIVKGLYKYTRNPIYHAYAIIALAFFLIFGQLLLLGYFTVSIVILYFYVTKYEEPRLIKRFGKDYLTYMKKVPRWFVKF